MINRSRLGIIASRTVWYTAGKLARAAGKAGDDQKGSTGLDSLALAQRIVDVAADRQASDILMLDLRALSPIADYFVICSGNSDRQLEALDREIVDQLRNNEHVRPRQREGSAQSGWILLDYGDVVVHIFSAGEREFYHLEDLWSAAPTVVRVQ
jgi:ribosome-associated protein